MEPTAVGACLIHCARDIQSRLNETRNELIDIDQNRVGRIALGVLPLASVLLVPKLIAYIEAMATSVAIKVTEGTTGSLLSRLRAGDIDLAIGLLPYSPLPAEFQGELLMEDQIIAAVRHGHPLTRLAEPTWEDLAQFPMILPPDDATTRLPIDAILAANRISAPHRRVETVSSMASVGALQFTDSIGFLAQTLAQHFAKLGVVSVLPLQLPNTTLRLGMIWLKDMRDTKANQLTQELLRAVCQEIASAVVG
jgi:DNA-binding transcriptional LysR family regulator